MNNFISNILICEDSTYYYFLTKHEHILREHIHFANNFQQERIKSWWRINPAYNEDIEDKLVDCDISYTFWNGLLLVGTIETERIELVKNPNWLKLYNLFQEDRNKVG